MATKVQNQRPTPAAPQRRPPQGVVKRRPSVPLASPIRQATLDPGSLSPSEMGQLQRMIGNRAVGGLLTQTAPPQPVQRKGNLPGNNGSGVIQAAFEEIFEQKKVPVLYLKDKGQSLTETEGRAYMARITAGDVTVLNELEIYGGGASKKEIQERIEKQAVECGLGKDPKSDRVAIYVGEADKTDWSPFVDAGLIALAHSHPAKGRNLDEQPVPLSKVFEDLHLGALILPSMQDLWFSADEEVERHTVYTPYKIIKDKQDYLVTNANPGKDAAELLSFEIAGAKEIEKKSENVRTYEGQLTAKWKNQPILQTTVIAYRHKDENLARSPVLDKQKLNSQQEIIETQSEITIESLSNELKELEKEKSLGVNNEEGEGVNNKEEEEFNFNNEEGEELLEELTKSLEKGKGNSNIEENELDEFLNDF